MPGKPRSIDDYLSRVSPEKRAALSALRAQIHRVLGEADECISYSMPAFRTSGKVVAGFLATSKGCSYFPFSGTTLGTLSAQLAPYSRTKSALHFDPQRGLPLALVRLLLRTRLAEIETNAPLVKAQPTKRAAKATRKTTKRRAKK